MAYFEEKMNTNSTIRLLAIFVLTLSMTAFAGTTRITPSTHLVRADYITTQPAQNSGPVTGSTSPPDNQWVPAGPMVDKILVTTYSDETAEFTALKGNAIDESDWTLSQVDAPTTCPSGTAIACDVRFWANQAQGIGQVASYGMFGIDFNHANTFFGINFGFGKDSNPQNAAAINFRQGVAHLIDRQQVVSTQFGSLANSMDNPLPPGQSFAHSGLPIDTTSQGTGGIGPYPFGGYSLQGVCGDPSAPTTVNSGWDSLDGQFRALGQVCKSAFKYGTDSVDSAGIVTASAANADFCDAARHWVAAGLGTGLNADCSIANFAPLAGGASSITFIVRRDNLPRFNIGQALASRMCQLIHGATSGNTCAEIVVNLLSIQETRPIVFATNVIHLDWHMYTLGWGLGATPEQVWALFNSAFAGNACGGVPGPFGTNYIYFCNAGFDHFNNMIEFNSTNAGAIASLQKADEIFGQHTASIDIYAQNDVFAYRKEWRGMVIAKGIGLPSFWPQFNSWSPTPAVPGELRWGWKQGTSNPNPMSFTTQWEGQWNGQIYDSLLAGNPYSPTDAFGWMVNNWVVQTPQPGDPPGTVSDVKFNLRNDIFFHDGKQVTASDYVFSAQAFFDTGGLFNPSTAGIVGIRVQNDFNFVVNLNSNSVFGLFNIGGFFVMPQHVLAADTTTKCTTFTSAGVGNTGPCGIGITGGVTNDLGDLVANDQFIGSGAYVCIDATVIPNKVGGKCSATGSGSVPFGSSITLTRNGFGVSGTANGAYFRDSAKYKQWQWADIFGALTVDITAVSSAAGCLGKAASATGCPHWDTRASNIMCVPGTGSCTSSLVLGGNGDGTVTFTEVQQAFRWFGVSWTSPLSYASLSDTTGCGGSGCGAESAAAQTLYEGGLSYGPP